jgi:hypothetical protein
LAVRCGQRRSLSTSSKPFRKQQTSTSSPENSGPAASSASRTRWRAAIIVSVALPAVSPAPRRPPPIGLDQFDVVLGIRLAQVKSARSRSPACNCCGAIMLRPSRPRRCASQASGLSDSSIVTSARPPSVAICRRAKARCRPRNASIAGWGAPVRPVADFPARARWGRSSFKRCIMRSPLGFNT